MVFIKIGIDRLSEMIKQYFFVLLVNEKCDNYSAHFKNSNKLDFVLNPSCNKEQ